MRREDRMRALFAGEEVDRPPFTLFFHLGHHHFHNGAAAFAEQEVQLFDHYQFDFMKVMNDFPHPMPEGVEVIDGPEDLLKMEEVEIQETPFSHQLQAIAILHRDLAEQRGCPFWDTLFNPWFTIRRHLLGDDIYRYMQEHPRALHHALDVVTENSLRYAAASIAQGAQGIYLSVLLACIGGRSTETPRILNGGYDGQRARADLANGAAALIAFGQPFIANPDLPERLRRGGPFNAPEMAYIHGGGARGYTDYPALDPSKDPA